MSAIDASAPLRLRRGVSSRSAAEARRRRCPRAPGRNAASPVARRSPLAGRRSRVATRRSPRSKQARVAFATGCLSRFGRHSEQCLRRRCRGTLPPAPPGSAPFTRGTPSLRGPALRRGVPRTGGTTPSRGEGDPRRRARASPPAALVLARRGPRGRHERYRCFGPAAAPARGLQSIRCGGAAPAMPARAWKKIRRHPSLAVPTRRSPFAGRLPPVPTKQAGSSRLRHGLSQPVRAPLGAVPPGGGAEALSRPRPPGSAPFTRRTPSLRGPALRRGAPNRRHDALPGRRRSAPARAGIASRRAGPRSAGNEGSP